MTFQTTEADTCRTLVTPKLREAGWESPPHLIAEQHYFTDGRIVIAGRTAKRRQGKRADYVLRFTRDLSIAVVEAKAESVGDLISRVKNDLQIEDSRQYVRITIHMNGRGISLRDIVQGSEIGTKRQFIARSGQLILSKIDARNGAFGILPASCDNAIITGNFWAFDFDHTRMSAQFFSWLTKTRTFIEFCVEASSGTTNRKYLNEARFLDQEIRLPPLPEQQRILRQIETIAPRIEEADRLNQESCNLSKQVLPSAIGKTFSRLALNLPRESLGSRLTRSRCEKPLLPHIEYKGVGTQMWGKGAYIHESRLGNSFSAERYEVKAGQFIYNEVWVHNGALGIVPSLGSNLVVSRHFHVFDVDWTELEPEYLQRMFQSHWFWQQCQAGTVSSTGRGHMRRGHLLGIQIPIPPISEQHQILEDLSLLEHKVSALRRFQNMASADLNALFPALLDKVLRGELV